MSRMMLDRKRLLVSALLLSTAALHAQLPAPRTDTSFPLGGKAGSEVEITLAGAELTELSTLLFDAPGFSVVKADAHKFRVTVAADCARGLHEFRAVGRLGISTPRPFVVSDATEIVDAGTNHSRDAATLLSLPCVVQGRMEAERRDVFRFAAKGGQTLHISCAAFALDSPVDPVFSVSDAAGRTLASADDERDRDAQLAFTAPADGDYILVVHDKLFAGSAAHIYRLALLTKPEELPLRTPASAGVLGGETAAPEVEPNDTAATAQPLELPAIVSGRFDNDYFAFRAEAGRALWIEVRAEQEGVASDPVVIVHKVTRDAAGAEQSKQVLELDDQAEFPLPQRWLLASRDPVGRFTPDETATYRVRVLDRFGRGRGFRLGIREATPEFALIALPDSLANEEKKLFVSQPNASRGGSAAFPVAALRRGYDGAITLRAEGLPDGVTATGIIPAGAQTGWLAFHAAPDAKAWAGFPRVVGEGGGITRDVQAMTYRWNVENRDNQRLAAHLCKLAVGVVEAPAPLTIAPAEEKRWEASIGGTLEIPLTITRTGQPKGEWQITPVAFAGLAKFDPLKIDGAAAKDAKFVLNLQNKDGNTFTPGTYTFFLRAKGAVTYKADEKAAPKDLPHMELSRPITVTLSAPAVPAK